MSAERQEEHTLTSREALKLFEQSGLPRSQRSIERYCRGEKLDCFLDPDEERYYITRESADRLIGQLKEIMARHRQTEFVAAGPTTSDHVRPGQTPPDSQQEATYAEKLKELEDKVFNLEVDKRAKDQFVIHLKDQIKADRDEFTKKLVFYSRKVGELETKLLQLDAPKHDPPRRMDEPQDAEFSEVEEQPEEPIPSEQRL